MENKYQIPIYRSIFTKMVLLAIFCGLLLFGTSFFVLNEALNGLQEDLIGSRLRTDINYISDIIGNGSWQIQGDTLYRGDVPIGNGTADKANVAPFYECFEKTGTDCYTFIRCPDEGLTWVGDEKTGYMQGHFLRVAGTTKGPTGEELFGTYMDKLVADQLDANNIYMGPANVNGRQIYCVYETLRDANGKVVGAMVVGRGISEMVTQIRLTQQKYILFSLISAALLLVVLCLIVIPWVLSIKRIEQYLHFIGAGTYPGEPLTLFSKDEMAIVANSINNMVENLKENSVLSSYRQGIKRKALFSVCLNASKGTLTEGSEAFSRFASEDGQVYYKDVLQDFIIPVVDPDHRELVYSTLDGDRILSQMELDPEFEVTFRLSPTKMVELIDLSEDAVSSLSSANRQWVWGCMRGVIVKDSNGDIVVYIDVFDVDQKMVNEENIRRMAVTDSLTGLLNRSAFEVEMSKYMIQRGSKGALFMFDLDHFKDVNDNLGHPKGDELLRMTADTLRQFFRGEDIICRLGGDEFCAFAKGFTDLELLQRKADSLLEAGRRSYLSKNGDEIKVSFSIGVALYPSNAPDYESLYSAADAALYKAKESGRNCHRFFNKGKTQ